MNKSIVFNLVKAAVLITLLGFFIDSDEFQGSYPVAILEFVMILIISLFFVRLYVTILLIQRLASLKL